MDICKRIVRLNGQRRGQYKCNKKATHKQTDGLPLCEHHYNEWIKKVNKSNTNK